MTLHERLDWVVALLVYAQAGAQGEASDFLPQWQKQGDGAHITDWLSAMARKP